MMNPMELPAAPARLLSRRRLITSLAIALGGVAPDSAARADAPAMKQAPASAANRKRTFLHQEISLAASPQRIYEVLLDAKQFAAFTGMAAEIDPAPGGAFSTFDGLIVGRSVELIPSQRIVQAWRPTHWDAGVYSMVKFELKPRDSGTLLVLDHSGFPQGEYDHLYPGWKLRYWDPLRKFLA